MKKLFLLIAILAITSLQSFAQKQTFKIKKWYTSNSDDQLIFSWRNTNLAGAKMGIRFSYMLNSGAHFNYNFTKQIGVYSGLLMRNIGEAGKINNGTSTTVYRKLTYNIGVPLGVRLGDLKAKKFVAFGTGVDLVAFSKEKTWTAGSKRATKEKSYCTFDTATNRFVPFVFLAVQSKMIGIKYQMYLGSMYKNDVQKSNLQYISLYFDTGKGGKAGKKTAKKITGNSL
jgi:hypothetical protein